MAKLGFTIVFSVNDFLPEIGRKVKDIKNIFDVDLVADQAAAIVLNRNRTRFLQERDPDDQPWIPSRSALIRKAGGYTLSNGRRVTGGGTLFATGRLFHSIQAVRGPVAGVRLIDTDVPYAAKHHFGLAGMVVRRILGVSEEDATVVQQLLSARFDDAMKKVV